MTVQNGWTCTTSGHCNLFNIGGTGLDPKLPALFIYEGYVNPNQFRIHITDSGGVSRWHLYDSEADPAANNLSTSINDGSSHSYFISISPTKVMMNYDGVTILDDTGDWDRSAYLNGSLYDLVVSGTNYYEAVDGTIYNLCISYSATNTKHPTEEPTESPTSYPTSAIPEIEWPWNTSTAFGPIAFDHNSTFNFHDRSMEIGWLQFSSCTEGNPSTGSGSNYHSSFNQSELFALLQYAVTVQIGPKSNVPGVTENTDWTNTADLCSNPVWALNNKYELSFVLDMFSSPTVCSIVSLLTNKSIPVTHHTTPDRT